MEKEKLLKSQELLVIVIILIFILLIAGGFYFYFQKVKDKINLIRQEIELSHQRQIPTLAPEPESPPDPTADWVVYYSEKFGFKFKYPKNWDLKVFNLGDTIQLFSETNEEIRNNQPEEEREYAALLIENYYLQGGQERPSGVYPFYPDCFPSQDYFILADTPLEDRLFCRCSIFIKLPDNVPFVTSKDQIIKTRINGLEVAACEGTMFDILIRDNILTQWSFHRPKAPGFIHKFDSTFKEILYSLEKIN